MYTHDIILRVILDQLQTYIRSIKQHRNKLELPTSGKWYFEAHAISGSANKFTIGNVQDQMIGVQHLLMFSLVQVLIHSHLHMVLVIFIRCQINRVTANQTSLTAFTGGDIVGVAFDVDNNQGLVLLKRYMGKW